MPKKKGLGRDINKSLEIIDNLLDSLRHFSKIPLKKGLNSNKVNDKDLVKNINDAREKAYGLSLLIEDLKDSVKGIKTDRNSRFASRVVQNFIQDNP